MAGSVFGFEPWTLNFGLGKAEPGLDVLLKTFLRFQAIGDNNYRSFRKNMAQ
jgi:hypothetical protein